MIDAVEVLWSPAGVTMPSLGTMALVDITDGDTPNIRMPVRMLSVDTPEVTARTAVGAERVDDNGRLLAYVAPNYSRAEREVMTRAQRSTFNLDMVRSGWAAPFVIYPSIPGELDLPIFLEDAADAAGGGRGIWANPETLLAYEYRSVEKLYSITKEIVDGTMPHDRYSWRDRYCADLRTRVLHGPEDYFEIDPVYRLWIWSADVGAAVGRLNLTPSRELVGTE